MNICNVWSPEASSSIVAKVLGVKVSDRVIDFSVLNTGDTEEGFVWTFPAVTVDVKADFVV